MFRDIRLCLLFERFLTADEFVAGGENRRAMMCSESVQYVRNVLSEVISEFYVVRVPVLDCFKNTYFSLCLCVLGCSVFYE